MSQPPPPAPLADADPRPTAAREWEVLFDALTVGMVVLDADGRIRRCNVRAVLLTGAEDDGALLGRDFWEAVLRTGTPRDDDPLRRAFRERRTLRASVRAESPERILDVTAAPHPDGGAVVTFDDVTQYHALAERHRRVIEMASDAFVISDPQRRVAFANPAAAAMFGIPLDELRGMPIAALVPLEHRDEVARREAAALEGEPQRYETQILRRDGERRIAQVASAPLREVGQIVGIVASLRDVTEERRARDAAMHTEARYRNLFETATDAIYTLDPMGAFTSANRAASEYLGVPRERLLGHSMLPFLDPEDVDEATDNFKAARAGLPTRYLCRFYNARGERRLASVTNTPVHRDGAVVGVLGIARDITDEVARDEALRRSEQRYARLVELAWDAIFTVDGEGRITSANQALEHTVGISRDELFGRPILDLAYPEEREAMATVMRNALAGERQRCELRYQHVDGTVRAGSLTVTPIVEEGRVTGALGVVRDVTEERRLAEQLHQREKLAAVGQLVSGVAHELNNPLAGILAFAQILLASAPASPEQLDALTTIHREAKRAAKIIGNLLLFARQRPPERVATSLNAVLQDTLELRRYALETHQVAIATELDPELPLTLADPFQLQQVFLNLLTNAEQAMRDQGGGRRIVLATRREGDRLVASVADSGPGIPSGVLERIFNPFYTTKPVGEGTGLGLSISDGIVREHGGQIRVESAPGAGTTFFVELPLVPCEPPPAHSLPDDSGATAPAA